MENQNRYEGRWGPIPHGGWLETAAKIGFFVLLAGLGGYRIIQYQASLPPAPTVSDAARSDMLTSARAIRHTFLARSQGWTSLEVVTARDNLVKVRQALPEDDHLGREQVDVMIRSVVDRAKEKLRRDASLAPDFATRQRLTGAIIQLDRDLSLFGHAGISQDQMNAILGGLLWIGLTCYLLFIPFVLLIFAARLRSQNVSISDEVIYGWKNVLLSTILWPFALTEYPRDTALAIRKSRIEAEYRARVGKTHWNDVLTTFDQRQIEVLVMVPRAELAARLAALSDMPTNMLWKARCAAYAGMVVGFLTASASASSAFAQESPSDAEAPAAAVIVEDPPPFALHGFAHVEMGVPDRPFALSRVWLVGDASPHPDITFRVGADMVGAEGRPMLRDAFMRIAPRGSPFSFRLGQMINRAVFMAPPPNQERLIGGSGAARFISFLDIGAEVAGQHGLFGWAIEVMSGTGPNMADANDQKDVMGSVAFGPFGPLRFELAFQAGQQPEGFRTRTAAHAAFALDTITVDALGTHQMLDGLMSWAASGMIGWRLHRALDLAAGYDEMHQAGLPTDRVVRAQATVHLLDDHLQVGAAYRWSLAEGYAGLGRIQLSF